MGHSNCGESASSSRVLPIIDEELESEMSELGSPESTRTSNDGEARRNKQQAVVSRMRELLMRAAAHSKLRSTVLLSAKKWKRVVVGLQRSRNLDQEQQRMAMSDGGGMSSPSPSVSSKNSFSWDVATSCSPSPAHSPMWPAFFSYSAAGQVSLPPAPVHGDDGMGLCCSGSASSRMSQWITTDSDFVVLEL